MTESPCLKRLRQVEIVASCLDEPQPRDHQFKDLCLQRDNYRCIATGQMDTGHWDKTGRPDGVLHAPTNGAHVIPLSYASWDNSTVTQFQLALRLLC